MSASWSYTITPPESSAASPTAAAVPIESVIPKDIALDETGDLALRDTAEGLKEAYLLEGADAVVQRLRISFQFFYGTWFLNQDEGVPYIEKILIHDPDIPLVEALFRRLILLTVGIKSIDTFTMSWDKPTRTLVITGLQVRLIDNTTLTLDETPLLLVGLFDA